MAFRFFDLFRPPSGKISARSVEIGELMAAGREFQIREACFWVCANMVANAIGRCEIKTYQNGAEIRKKEYYMWNIEPNRAQNSTAFWHKTVSMLYKENDALIIPEPYGDGVVVADTWDVDESAQTPLYTGISIGSKTVRNLREKDVLHLKLNHKNMEKVIGALNDSFLRLARAAMNNYLFNNGQHWKVEIGRAAQGDEELQKKFTEILETQIKPFFEKENSILPQFDGFRYERVAGTDGKSDTKDIRDVVEEIFNFTARGFNIPIVLVNGQVEGTADANARFLTGCVDPLADQIAEEINRKRFGYEDWARGDFVRMDTSSILHFDIFANAANVEKLIGSGAWSVNEIRKAAGEQPIPEAWADQHFLTLNISTMAEAVKEQSQRR